MYPSKCGDSDVSDDAPRVRAGISGGAGSVGGIAAASEEGSTFDSKFHCAS